MNQKQTQRHKTSIFSEYENNSGNSVSSKQLQLWLLQMAPTSHTSPKFGQDWNLMSTSSRYESDGMTFGARMDTFESANKQNILNKANFIIQNPKSLKQHHQSLTQPQNSQKLKSSKSYINAMQQLQKRAKTLEQQNCNMRKSLTLLQQQKRNSLHSSMVESQQMKSKVFKFEESEKKIQEMKKQNKKLRDSKNQQSLKVKLMQKSINQQKSKVQMFQQRLNNLSKQNQELKQQLIESNNITKSLLVQNKHLATKTQTLQNMKQRSTNSILEKYGKALQRIEQLQMSVSELKNKGNVMQQKNKRVIEDKDAKYLQSLEIMNGLKLQKQQLSMRVKNSSVQIQQKSKKLQRMQQINGNLQKYNIQKSKQIQNLIKTIKQKQQKNIKERQKYEQLKIKYEKLLTKYKIQKQKYLNQINILNKNRNKQQNKQYQNQQQEQQLNKLIQQQQNKNKIIKISQQKLKYYQNQQNTPVQQYQPTSPQYQQFNQYYQQTIPQYQHTQLQQFIPSTKPLSIIINAKKSQPKIKTQEQQLFNSHEQQKYKLNNNNNSSQHQSDSLTNQKYIKNIKKPLQINNNNTNNLLKQNQKSNRKSIDLKQQSKQNHNKSSQNNSKQKSTSKQLNQHKSKSKQSSRQSIAHKPLLNESKYMISSTNKKNKQNKIIVNNSLISSHNRSKSTSIEKKKSTQKKSGSVDSKRHSLANQQTGVNTTQRQNNLQKSSQQTQSRYVNQKSSDIHMYNSAQQNRYHMQYPQHYYYTNQINGKRNYDQHNINLSKSFHQQSYLNQTSNKKYLKNQQFLLNAALEVEFQQEALKLYEESQRLVQLLNDENLTVQQRAQTIGRMRQINEMIEHNTNKIIGIKQNNLQNAQSTFLESS